MTPRKARNRTCNGRIVRTKVRVLPTFATSLRNMLMVPQIQERLKFHIAPSQVHTDGKCEILAIKQDMSVLDSSITDHVGNFVRLLESKPGTQLDDPNCLEGLGISAEDLNFYRTTYFKTSEDNSKYAVCLDSTIELSDMDDSVCILPLPATQDLRNSSLKPSTSVSQFVEGEELKSVCITEKDNTVLTKKVRSNGPTSPSSSRIEVEDDDADKSVVVLEKSENSHSTQSSCQGSAKQDIESNSSLDHSSNRIPQNSHNIAEVADKTDREEGGALLMKIADRMKTFLNKNIIRSSVPDTSTSMRQTETVTLNKTAGVGSTASEPSKEGSNLPLVVDSDDDSSEDDIIIEKELPKNWCTSTGSEVKPVIIDDVDDDVVIFEVKRTSSSDQMGKVHQKIPKRSTRPAPDFIPLSSSSKSERWVRAVDTVKNRRPRKKKKGAPLDPLPLREKTQRKSKEDAAMAIKEELKGKLEQRVKLQEKKEKMKNARKGIPKTERSEGSQPSAKDAQQFKLRPIIIDANNVAMGHRRKGVKEFSVHGLKICVKHFQDRGHKVIALAPKFRRFHVSPEDRKVLDKLEEEGVLSYTPSRTLQDGRKVSSYDDRFIVEAAHNLGGVIVSTDNYRDLLEENENWRETIEQRLLMFTWVGDMLMFPTDPLGRKGPNLEEFLRFPV